MLTEKEIRVVKQSLGFYCLTVQPFECYPAQDKERAIRITEKRWTKVAWVTYMLLKLIHYVFVIFRLKRELKAAKINYATIAVPMFVIADLMWFIILDAFPIMYANELVQFTNTTLRCSQTTDGVFGKWKRQRPDKFDETRATVFHLIALSLRISAVMVLALIMPFVGYGIQVDDLPGSWKVRMNMMPLVYLVEVTLAGRIAIAIQGLGGVIYAYCVINECWVQ